MARKITFNKATAEGPVQEAGEIAMFKVGDKRHKFVIHGDVLSDYRTGYKLASFADIKIERMCRISSFTKTTNREAAEIMLGRIIAKAGLEKVQSALAAMPTLNA